MLKAAQEVKEFDITGNNNYNSAERVVTEFGICYTFNSKVAFVGIPGYVYQGRLMLDQHTFLSFITHEHVC